MEIFKVKSSLGSLGKECSEEAPDLILNELGMEGKEIKINKSNVEETNKTIYNVVKKIKKGILIGGDHSITYPSFKAFSEIYKDGCLVIFDAHVDCANNFKPATHEDFLRVILEEKLIKDEDVYLIGVRKIYDVEKTFLEKRKINFVDNVNGIKSENIYLSLDIDVINTNEAPGVIYRVKGGLSEVKLKTMLNKIKDRVKMMDLVEVVPKKDKDNKTVKLAARLVGEML